MHIVNLYHVAALWYVFLVCHTKCIARWLQGTLEFGVVATDKLGHSVEVAVLASIIDSDKVALFTVSKEISEVKATINEFVGWENNFDNQYTEYYYHY